MPFGPYGEAMVRKLDIAEFHLAELKAVLPSKKLASGLPPVPVQAHFEASGRAVLSIADQLASGVAFVLDGALPRLTPEHAFLDRLAERLQGSPLGDFLEKVNGDARHKDLRSWRNRSTHRFDTKAYADGWWFVAWPEGAHPYDGSRRIDEYLATMIDFGSWVVSLGKDGDDLASEFTARRLA